MTEATWGEKSERFLQTDDDGAPIFVCRLPTQSVDASFVVGGVSLALILFSFLVAFQFDLRALPSIFTIGGLLANGAMPFAYRRSHAVTEFRPDGIVQFRRGSTLRLEWSEIERIDWRRNLTATMFHRIVFSRDRVLMLPPDVHDDCQYVLELVGAMRPDIWGAFLHTGPKGRSEPRFPLRLDSRATVSRGVLFSAMLAVTGFLALMWFVEPDLTPLLAIFFYPVAGLFFGAVALWDRATRARFIFDETITIRRYGRTIVYPYAEFHGHRTKRERDGGIRIHFFLGRRTYVWRAPWNESVLRIHYRLMDMYATSNTAESAAIGHQNHSTDTLL